MGNGNGAIVADLAYVVRGKDYDLLDLPQEIDPDRWCSHTAWGQEFWLILAQWIWNLRLEMGHALHPTPMHTTEFAPAGSPGSVVTPSSAVQTVVSYEPPVWAVSRMGCIAGKHFTLQPDGTLQCPAGFPLYSRSVADKTIAYQQQALSLRETVQFISPAHRLPLL